MNKIQFHVYRFCYHLNKHFSLHPKGIISHNFTLICLIYKLENKHPFELQSTVFWGEKIMSGVLLLEIKKLR